MSNKVFINQHDVVEIIVDGDQTVKSVTQMSDAADKLLLKQSSQGKPALVLDNLMLMGKVSAEARKTVVARAKTMPYEKFAFVSNDRVVRLGANLILQAIGKGSKVKYFDKYKDAIAWLKSK